LVEFEKLFDMPALWIMNSQILDFVTGDGGQEGFEIIILGPFTVTLNETVKRLWAAALFEAKRFLRGGIASPPAIKALRAQSLVMEFRRVLRRHRHEQFKGGLKMDVIEELGRVMLAVG
jgi:hypothetical protein